MSREGWKCPVCNRGVAPDEKHCEHGGMLQPVPVTVPWNVPAEPAPNPWGPWPGTTDDPYTYVVTWDGKTYCHNGSKIDTTPN